MILSPHLDDAVLSLWHRLAAAEPVEVVNVLAGIPGPEGGSRWWDRLTGAPDSSARMRARRAEDERALALAGRQPVHLDLLEGQYREEELSAAEIAEAIAGAVPAAATLLAPAALDGHRSHRAVRDAALTLRGAGHPIVLYADVPHATVHGWPAWVTGADDEPGRDPAGRWADELGSAGLALEQLRACVHVLDDAALAAKTEAVRTYRTQLPALEAGWGATRPAVLRYEVLWPLEP